jgi:hypothetical protein
MPFKDSSGPLFQKREASLEVTYPRGYPVSRGLVGCVGSLARNKLVSSSGAGFLRASRNLTRASIAMIMCI